MLAYPRYQIIVYRSPSRKKNYPRDAERGDRYARFSWIRLRRYGLAAAAEDLSEGEHLGEEEEEGEILRSAK